MQCHRRLARLMLERAVDQLVEDSRPGHFTKGAD
jgi:hypothetical protein